MLPNCLQKILLVSLKSRVSNIAIADNSNKRKNKQSQFLFFD